MNSLCDTVYQTNRTNMSNRITIRRSYSCDINTKPIHYLFSSSFESSNMNAHASLIYSDNDSTNENSIVDYSSDELSVSVE